MIKGNLVLKEEKVYMLREKKLRTKIIWLYHDVPAAGHRER